MKFMVLIYNDTDMLGAMPERQFDTTMRQCLDHADELRDEGYLLDSQQLEAPSTAKTIRVRKGRQTVVDGPFAETKEVLGGFNIIEARDIDDAVRIASTFPWASVGSIEVRPVRDIAAVRQRVSKAS
jgi:hypothetical protein